MSKDFDANWSPWKPIGGSSGGRGASSNSSSSSASSGGHKAAGAYDEVVGPRCWADLEDPRRNAEYSSLTWQESLSDLGAFEGDAKPIGICRCGVVYQKRFDDWDLAIKILLLDVRRDKDDATETELRDELANEAMFYQRNSEPQGVAIPRFFGLRTLQLGICFVTEYIGPSLDTLERITKEQSQSALDALSALHRQGILHGDAELRNIVWNKELQQAYWIDLSFGVQRSEMCSDFEWESITKEEYNKVKAKLSDLDGNSPMDGSKKRLRNLDLFVPTD